MINPELEAFAHAIMKAAHEHAEPDKLTVKTHTLALQIKKLLPDFSYHEYIAQWKKDTK